MPLTTSELMTELIAGGIGGSIGILVGNPFDFIKVRAQNSHGKSSWSALLHPHDTHHQHANRFSSHLSSVATFFRGVVVPAVGFGVLNACLFVSYHQSLDVLHQYTNPHPDTNPPALWSTMVAGALGGLATWWISAPTELIKCRAQATTSQARHAHSSLYIAKEIFRKEGVRGLYFGGTITAIRDSIGYSTYFLAYEWSTRLLMPKIQGRFHLSSQAEEMAKVLLCGGFAGMVTWSSIYPVDVVKTRLQTQVQHSWSETTPLLGHLKISLPGHTHPGADKRKGSVEIYHDILKHEGWRGFTKGYGICMARAFVCNGVQFMVYEWTKKKLHQHGMV